MTLGRLLLQRVVVSLVNREPFVWAFFERTVQVDLLDEAFRTFSRFRLSCEESQILYVIVLVAPLERLMVHTQLIAPLHVQKH